ncbi:MAG: choice-of-anchor A family protein [Clostridia bacterium]|nr:choice-of-anchor A family protein [Clostridia bacterium]
MENRELKYLFSAKGIILSVIALIAAVAGVLFSVNASKTYRNVKSYGNPVVSKSGQSSSGEDDSPVMSYKELSYSYKSLNSTCMEWTDKGEAAEGTESGLYFISQDNLRYCIYGSDSEALCGGDYKLSDFNYMWLNSEDDGFYVIVNLAGKNIDLSGYYILARDSGYMYASRVLINCYEAETVDLGGAILTGTLLAPYAKVSYDGTYVFGQVLADSEEGECVTYREIRFSGYYNVMSSQDDALFVNDSVRAEAVRYLMEHNDNGLYDGYTASSGVRKSDLNAVKELDLTGTIFKGDINRDLAMLPNLETLKLSGTNVSVLALENHEYLVDLEVNETPLSALVLSGAPSLMRLSLENTTLKDLDLSANSQLRILCLSGSPVGKFPEVSEPLLEYLDISNASIDQDNVTGVLYPSLKTLIASSNPGLRGIALNTFNMIESVDISDTSVASLELPDDPRITYLRVSNTEIEVLDLTKIRQLYVCECYSEKLKTLIINRYADKLYTDVTPTVIAG